MRTCLCWFVCKPYFWLIKIWRTRIVGVTLLVVSSFFCLSFTVSLLVVNIGCVQELNASIQLSATETPGVRGVFCILGSSWQRSPSGRPLWGKTAPRLYWNSREAGQAKGKLWRNIGTPFLFQHIHTYMHACSIHPSIPYKRMSASRCG